MENEETHEVAYKGYIIEASPLPAPDGWIPKAWVRYDEGRSFTHTQVESSEGLVFQDKEEAVRHSMLLAKKWIDQEVG